MMILFELDMMGKLPSRCKIRNQKIAKEKVVLSQSNWKLHLEEESLCSLLLCLCDCPTALA